MFDIDVKFWWKKCQICSQDHIFQGKDEDISKDPSVQFMFKL